MKITENLDLQEELADKDAAIIDDSAPLKENKTPIDRDTVTNSPTKGPLSTANELIAEADYTPPIEKIEAKALDKLKKKKNNDVLVDEVLNFQPKPAPEKDDIVEAAEVRKARADAHDIYGTDSKEYAAAKKAEENFFAEKNFQPMSEEDADKILEDFTRKVEEYETLEGAKNEYMNHLKSLYTAELNKIIEDDTISWTKRKLLIDKTGLLFGHVMQNIGAMMHNIANPNNWIEANDPITLRMGQNLANTVKNRQTNNDTYIENQVDYWKNVLPEYYDTSKIKQRLGNTRILNTYKRLDNSAQRIIMSLAASDAWDAVSDNAILVYMDKLQNGEFTSVPQMLGGLLAAGLTSSGENKDKVLNKIIEFASGLGVDVSELKDSFKKLSDTAKKVDSGVSAGKDGISNAIGAIKEMTGNDKEKMTKAEKKAAEEAEKAKRKTLLDNRWGKK